MDFRDVATGKLHEGGPPVVGRIGFDQHGRARSLRLCHGRIDVEHLVTCQLSHVRGLPRNGYHNVRRSARTPYPMSVAVPTPAA